MLLLFLIIGLVTIIAIVLWRFSWQIFVKNVKTVNGDRLEDVVPILPGILFFGNNFDFLTLTAVTVFQKLREYAKRFGYKSYLLHAFRLPYYCVVTPEDAEQFLSSQQIIQKGFSYTTLQTFLGTGLLTGTGKKWHSRRKLLTPAYHFNILEKFLDIFKDESLKFVRSINDSFLHGETSLGNIIPRFTLNNICETALGVKLDDLKEGDEYRHNVNTIEDFLVRRQVNVLLHDNFMYQIFSEKSNYEKFVAKVHHFSNTIIKNRRSQFVFVDDQIINKDIDEPKKKRYAMLDTLLAAEAKGLNIDHAGICEEVDTFMFEGYDTTSAAIMFILFMLARHPDVQQKVFDEIKEITNNIDSMRIPDFNKTQYLDCVIKETLRLYPSVPLIMRELDKDYTIGNMIFPKTTQILIHIFDIHRHPDHYPEPEKFIPERFLPENSIGRHPFSYVPFSAGPRNCIGQKFALLEIKVLIMQTIINYHLQPVTKLEDVKLIAGLVLRTEEPIKIKFTKRNL